MEQALAVRAAEQMRSSPPAPVSASANTSVRCWGSQSGVPGTPQIDRARPALRELLVMPFERVVVAQERVGKFRASLLVAIAIAAGLTFYSLSAERHGRFICTTSACVSIWKPLLVARGVTPTGVKGLSIVKRWRPVTTGSTKALAAPASSPSYDY